MVCSAHVNIGDVLVIPSPSIHHVLLPNLVSIVAMMARNHVIRSPLSLPEVDYWCVCVLQSQVVSYNGGRLPNTQLSGIELCSYNPALSAGHYLKLHVYIV